MKDGKSHPKREEALPVVAIGASAGGLKALQAFFDNMPDDAGIAFVVTQHLSTARRSRMAEILKKHTGMEVKVLENGMAVRKNTVFLTPPDAETSLKKGIFHLHSPLKPHGQSFPIDFMFRSIAEDRAGLAICVLLSGSGSDGTLGLEAVKGAGGLIIVQDGRQADYGGMPDSAIKTGLVDLILPAEKMAEEIIRFARYSAGEAIGRARAASRHFDIHAQKILLLLRSSQGHDFTHYKQSMIQRRLERRMAIHRFEDISDYHDYFRQNPKEGQVLARDLLIGVTRFFRDDKNFLKLKELVLSELTGTWKKTQPLRIWVPGCATGEEAYSLAILIRECMSEADIYPEILIFATDADGSRIDRARAAIYTESIAADVDPERLQKFFTMEKAGYRIRKEIRDMIVFSVHNIVTDPPFSRLDLISCRNLLMYMDAVLQRKVLPLLHYTLNDGGYLFLGSSESTGQYSDLFATVNQRAKIFQKKEQTVRREIHYPPLRLDESTAIDSPATEKGARKQEPNHGEMLERALLKYFTSPSVLIDERNNALYFRGNTERYLSPPAGEACLNVLRMCRAELLHCLSIALHKAMRDRAFIRQSSEPFKLDKEDVVVEICVCPLKEASDERYLIVFQEKKCEKKSSHAAGKSEASENQVALLEQELQTARDYLQSNREQLDTANEELKITNEELQSTNEELLSTNDELESAKEELQSSNEELVTINSELQSKVEELELANNDIENLFTCIDTGTIFLDSELRIKRFNQAAARIFALHSGASGRHIGNITAKIDCSSLLEDISAVLKTGQKKELEARSSDGMTFIMSILPYMSYKSVPEGTVITFTDITAHRSTEDSLRESEEKYRTLYETMAQGVVYQDRDGKITFANPAAMSILGLTIDQMTGKTSLDPHWRSIHEDGTDFPGEAHPSSVALKTGKPVRNVVMGVYNPEKSGYRWIIINATPQFKDGEDKPFQVYTTFTDITERKTADNLLRESEGRIRRKLKAITDPEGDFGVLELSDIIDAEALQSLMDDFFDVTGIGIAILDLKGKILVAKGWQDICTKFHRMHPDTSINCLESDTVLSEGIQPGTFRLYRCKNSMWDMATPITVGDIHIGNLFLGQFFFDDEIPDYGAFRSQAQQYGFNEIDYLTALKKVPRWNRNTVNAVMRFYSKLACILSSLGLSNVKLARILAERERLLSDLRQSEARYRRIVTTATEGVFVVDRDFQFTFVNSRMAELIGYSSEEMLGRRVEFIMHPEDLAEHFRQVEDRKQGKGAVYKRRFMKKDGAVVSVIISASPVTGPDGEFDGSMGLVTDITDYLRVDEERSRLQEQLYQARKMEAVGTLAGGIAHDFNNLLAGIMNGLSVLEIEKSVKLEHMEYLSEMKALCSRGADLTRQLLGFARQGKYEAQPMDLNAAVDRMAAMFGRTRKDVTMDRELSAEIPAIKADKAQIEQVILNLLVNAGQAMPDGGRISLRTDTQALSAEDAEPFGINPGRYVRLSVVDTGIGMDAETKERIFEPFFTTKEVGRGTGLGLASAFGIVKNHGGAIKVESEPGKGATFTISIPATDREVPDESAADSSPRFGSETILIVDDEEQIVKTIGRLLGTAGYKVLSACSGEEAIEIFRQNHSQISLAILDMIMPGMSGHKVLSTMREISPAVKVLISSGYSVDDQAAEILENENTSFLQKPFGMAALSEKLRSFL